MPDTSDKLVEIAAWAGHALGSGAASLGNLSAEDAALRLPEELLSDPLVEQARQQARLHAQALGQAATALETAAQAGDKAATVAKLVATIDRLRSLVEAVDALVQAIRGRINTYVPDDGTARQAAEAFADTLARGIVDRLVFDQLESTYPSVLVVLKLLGLAEWERTTTGPGGTGRAYVKKRLRLDRLPALFSDPAAHFQQTYQWGLPGFDPTSFFQLYLDFQGEHSAAHITQDGPDPVLRDGSFFIRRQSALSPPGLETGFRIGLAKTAGTRVETGPHWGFQLGADFDLEGQLSVQIEPPFRPSLMPPAGEVKGRVEALFNRNPSARPFNLLGSSDLLQLSINDVALGVALGAKFNPATGRLAFEPLLVARLDEATLRLGSGQADSFVGKLLQSAEIEGNFDLGLEWSPEQGLRVQASGGVEVALPLHKDLGFIRIGTLYLALRLQDNGNLALETSVDLQGRLGPLQVVVERIGAQLNARFTDDTSADIGPLDLSLGFKPPNGLGLSVDAGVVKGGGYLFFDFDRGEYAGALELVFSNWIALKAIGLVTTRMPDGSAGFSLLVIITVEFGTGIQLGMGFTLLGVGGLLGLNRTVNIDPLREAVRTGAVESVMFPQNVVENAPRILSDLRSFFPTVQDQFLVGPMAKIGWGTPTLVRVSLGVILEFPNVTLTILGVIKVTLPDENKVVLKLQVNFVGRIEPNNKLLWFYAELFDSRVLFLTLEGGMGLLVHWGDQPNFVLSVGGFHPRYTPPPLPFPAPPRIAVNLLNAAYARVRIEGYFAVTSNSAQFGARVEVFFGLSAFSIEGHLAFDALFRFDPFYFSFSLSVSLSVKVFGIGFFSVGFSGLLEGPTPWHIKGEGRISLLFFDISVPFEETWGENAETQLPPIAVLPLLEAEYNALTNWEALLPAGTGLLVSLRKLGDGDADALVFHPVGQLRISQRKIPLNLVLEKVGSQKPADVNQVTVTPSGAWQSQGKAQEPFALGQFKDLDDAKKLSTPGFEPCDSGIVVSAAGTQLRTSQAVKRVIRYETVVLDNNFKRHQIKFFKFLRPGFMNLYGTLFGHYLAGSAVSQSVLSQHQRKRMQPFGDAVTVQPHGYSVAYSANNQPLPGAGSGFTSRAAAEDFLQQQLFTDPALADTLHVIPNTEIAFA